MVQIKLKDADENSILKQEGQAVNFCLCRFNKRLDSNHNMDSYIRCIKRKFITATGGTITTTPNFKIHTFTGPGSFVLQQVVVHSKSSFI